MKKIVSAIAVSTSLFLTACGGGGGGSSSTPTPTPTSTLKVQSIAGFSIPAIGVRTSVKVTTTASSGLPVTYTTTTPTICTVSGNTITGVSFGTCSITANQAGNTTFSAALAATQTVVVGAQTISLHLPSLMAGQTVPITARASSGFPVTLTSLTPTVCTISGMLLHVNNLASGSCIFTVSQVGNSQYLPIEPIDLGGFVHPANSILVSGALPIPASPQAGSTLADPMTTFEGIYSNAADAVALIDGDHNIQYFDSDGMLFGRLLFSGLNWNLDGSSIYYSSSNVASIPTGTGTLTTKNSFLASSQSFVTNPTPLSLAYTNANGFAVEQSSVSGNWVLNDNGAVQIQLTVSNTGAITGTYTDNTGSLCALSGTLIQSDATTKHNMFNVAFHALNAPNSGATCNADISNFQGLAAIRFLQVTPSSANGVIPELVIIARTSSGSHLWLKLYKQNS